MLMLMPRPSRGEASDTVSTALLVLALKNLLTLSVLQYATIKKIKAIEMIEDVKYFPNA